MDWIGKRHSWYLNQQNTGPFMLGLDFISPKVFPDLVRTSLAVMVTLHTAIIIMRRNMNACIGTYSVHSPPPAHTVHTCQHVHKNIPPVHSMDRYGPACHVDRHSQCSAVSTCPPAQAPWGIAGGCRECGGCRGSIASAKRIQGLEHLS